VERRIASNVDAEKMIWCSEVARTGPGSRRGERRVAAVVGRPFDAHEQPDPAARRGRSLRATLRRASGRAYRSVMRSSEAAPRLARILGSL